MAIQTREDLIRAIARRIYDIRKDADLLEYGDADRDWDNATRAVNFIDSHNLLECDWIERHKWEEYKELGFIALYDEWKENSIRIST